MLAASEENGLEGVVAKRLDSPYRPGLRSPDWRKIKNFRTQAVVVGGWRPGQGRRTGTIGSLLVGVPDDEGRLVYVGHVGTGFSDQDLRDLQRMFTARKDPPFEGALPREVTRDAHWVEPDLVGRGRLRRLDGGRPAAAPGLARSEGRPRARRRRGGAVSDA